MHFITFFLSKLIVIFFLSLISYRTIFSTVTSICPNKCTGHGYCSNSSIGSCSCYPTYTGYDCSLRVCPSGYAWVDVPTDEYTAHAKYTECSNMGICDRSTGICSCKYGFEGAACDIMKCPTGVIPYSILTRTNVTAICSGNGRCVSLHDVTRYQTFRSYLDYTQYSGWDEYKIFGCVCENGWEGNACEKRSCPKGYDPLISSRQQVNEIQYLDCQCYSTGCTGGLYISFEGQQTPLIPYNAAAELIQYRLNQFTSVDNLIIQVEIVYGTAMCSSTGSVTQITFKYPQGPKSAITVLAGGGLYGQGHNAISVRSNGMYSLINWSLFSRRGSVSTVECSNRGICDYSSGICNCFDGFRSSNGLGGSGNIGDCGYQYKTVNSYTFQGNQVTTTCPFNISTGICSGSGQCNEITGICSCYTGYGGPSCNLRTCGSSFAWFGNVDENHVAKSECAGVGTCDTVTGLCSNCGGGWGIFSGDNCEELACPVINSKTCSGNGTCLTLKEIAELRYNEQKIWSPIYYTQPWDSNLIRGCSCLRAISVDNQYSIKYANYERNVLSFFSYNATGNATTIYTDADITKFYRGPYAFAATDFKGYACQQAYCPKGDNPRTHGVNEIQVLKCAANNGTFYLSFRENITYPIPWNASLYEFKTYLEELFTIGEVIVSNNGPNYLCSTDTALCENYDHHGVICNTAGSKDVYIEFLTEFGDLPLIKPVFKLIHEDHYYNFKLNITQYQKGTKEDLECSGQGNCNEASGICSCYDGFGSSTGLVNTPGERGDCTFYNKFYTSSHKFLSMT